MDASLFPARARENSLSPEERNALVLSCQKLCRAMARKAAFGVSGVDADDLEQEALVACVEASARWHPDQGTKFSTYATPCIQRHLNNIVTRVRCEGNVNVESWDSVADPRTLEDAGDAETATESSLTPQQREAVARLPEQSRVAVLLVLEGFAPDRIATRLGLEVKDVKLILRNAEKQLRKDLAWVELPGLFGITDEFHDAA